MENAKRFDIRHGLLYHSQTMKAIPKHRAERDEKYLQFVRTLPCAVCNRPAPSHAHHHPADGQSSVGLKTSDLRAVPLCGTPVGSRPSCHDRVHQQGKKTFWGDFDVEVLISRLNILFFTR